VRLFLDASVLLAASASARGASHEIFRRATINGWTLVRTPYAIDEVLRKSPGLLTIRQREVGAIATRVALGGNRRQPG